MGVSGWGFVNLWESQENGGGRREASERSRGSAPICMLPFPQTNL